MICKIQKRENPYTQVDKAVLKDDRLSFKAKGILVYLLSHPRNWEIRVDDIIKQSKDGRDSIYSGLKELRTYGYAVLEVERSKKGTISKQTWVIHEVSLDPDLPYRAQPDQAKPHHTNNDKKNNNECEPPPAGSRLNGLGLVDGIITKNSPEAKLTGLFAQFTIKRNLYFGKTGSTKTGWTKGVLQHWCQICRELIDQLDGDSSKVEEMMLWYFDNWKDQYVPKCYTMKTFRARWVDLWDYRRRNGESESSDDSERVSVQVDEEEVVR